MGMILIIILTQLIATIVGATMLIQIGGVLPIMVASLLILGMMLNTSLVLASGVADSVSKKNKKQEQDAADLLWKRLMQTDRPPFNATTTAQSDTTNPKDK